MTDKILLKEKLFNQDKVNYLAKLINNAYPEFNINEFSTEIINELPKLELKQRINCISINLKKYLPNNFKISIKIIIASLPKELNPDKNDNDFGDFIFAPLANFIAKNGLTKVYLSLSFNALAEITKRFSCEDAIRFFINKYPNMSFAFMQKMSYSSNYHQRRLASEGLRPKLPWCIGINFDYKKAVIILDNLYFDNTRFVVRSVANHLNDVSKIDANLVIKILQKWQQEAKQIKQKELDYLIRHSLRTLVKQGNIQALNLLGFKENPHIQITYFKIKNTTINLGQYLEFSFNILPNKNEKIMIDYRIIYPLKNNKTSIKVFKIKQIHLKKNLPIIIEKKYLFKKMTTKKLYFGNYKIQLQINGKIFTTAQFKLE